MINLSGFRPENVLFGGRIKVKETLKRTQAGLAHGSVAARDASVLASSGALSGPGSTLTTGATLLATDGFAAGKANQMLVGMLNFSNAPQTAQFLAQNHNLAMVGGASLGLASLYASKFPIGFLNRQAASLADLYPNAKKAPESATMASLPTSSASTDPVAPSPAPASTNKPVEIAPPAPAVSETAKAAKPEPKAEIPISPVVISPTPVALQTTSPEKSFNPISGPVSDQIETLPVTAPAAVDFTAEQPLPPAELKPTEVQPAENPPASISTKAQPEATQAPSGNQDRKNEVSNVFTEPATLLPNQTQGRVRKALSKLYTPVEFLMGKLRRGKKQATETPKTEPT